MIEESIRDKTNKPAESLALKKKYTKAALVTYGKVANLTAGGSLGKREQHEWQTQKDKP